MNNWLNAFKLAIITQDVAKCETLISTLNTTTFTCKEELQEAVALTQEAITLFESQKQRLGNELAKLKRTKKYLSNHTN
ncbi:hypothetical protein JWV37_07085 [Sulfurospirillum sp. T05]|uniref:PH domain-containing protein n=1 Tax=Sulfurospirillum tamanense TaxID=2813362 RepID=A0ABS2WTM9_9BACT|nr:hypothetical protein [Sulfurospirillum tamanensis]MBN2964539.1 hypothetical protein [Sulfurospirillum tamanensis]